MLALKKKREAEAKAKAAAAAAEATNPTSEPSATAPAASAPTTKKVSLLGVGGKKKKTGEDGKKAGKKRTPGEIRIQKGKCILEYLRIAV